MTNINENLQKMLSARYGRDMRQAIHDSINAINNKVELYDNTEIKKQVEELQNSMISEEQIDDRINELLTENRLASNWDKKMCPNIYCVANGSIKNPNTGSKRSYVETLQLLKSMNITQVSLLVPLESIVDGKFTIQTNVDYADVVNKAHDNGITVKSVRFSNSIYGKDKMCNTTALRTLSKSVPILLEQIGVKNEIEFVGILNETSQAYFDETLTDDIVECINSIKSQGLKVAFSDNARFCVRIPEPILEVLDYIGFNEYPIAKPCGSIETATVNGLYNAIESYQTEMYARMMLEKGVIPYMSEYGCSNKDQSLKMPSDGVSGNYVGMKYIAMYINAWNNYFDKYNMLEYMPYHCQWYVDIWEESEEMSRVVNGGNYYA